MYHRNVVRALVADSLRSMRAYQRPRTHIRRAHTFFGVRRDVAPDTALVDEYIFECERLIAVVDAYKAILGGIAGSEKWLTTDGQAALAEAAEVVRGGLRALDRVIARAEPVKKAHLQPQLLRDLSRLRAYLATLAAAIAGASASEVAAGRLRAILANVSVGWRAAGGSTAAANAVLRRWRLPGSRRGASGPSEEREGQNNRPDVQERRGDEGQPGCDCHKRAT